jgi:hypothetical protein
MDYVVPKLNVYGPALVMNSKHQQMAPIAEFGRFRVASHVDPFKTTESTYQSTYVAIEAVQSQPLSVDNG